MIAFCDKMDYKYPLYLAIGYLTKGFIAYDNMYLAGITGEQDAHLTN